MNGSNPIETPNMAVELFNDLRVSSGVDMTGLKRKSRAEDLDEADEEEDTIGQAIHHQLLQAIVKVI